MTAATTTPRNPAASDGRSSPPHLVRAVQTGDGEFAVALAIDCPWEHVDRPDRRRDCVVLACAPDAGEHDGHHGDDQACPELPGECLAVHWLEAAGPEAIDLVGFDGLDFPVQATVSWGGEGPALTALGPTREQATASRDDEAELPQVRVAAHTICALPDGHHAAHAYQLRVEDRGDGRWAVTTGFGECLSATGEWDHEPQPSSRTDDWLNSHRFDLDEALRRAQEAAVTIRVNGVSAVELLRKEESGG